MSVVNLARSLSSVLRVVGLSAAAFAGESALGQSVNHPIQDDVIYQIMPITYRDSDNDVRSGQPAHFGDFNGLTASIPYWQYLGITAVYLQPIFPSPAYHGYQHNAANTLNTWFGTQTDFQNFVNAAHTAGIKVFLDFVAYGISTQSTYFTSAYRNPSSPYDTWLAFTNSGNSQYTGSTYTTWNGSSVGFIYWNLATTAAASTVTSWALQWLDPNGDGNTSDGVDGYRLDHAYSSAPEGWGATISWWQSFASAVRAKKPSAFVFCEPGDWGDYGTDLLTPTGFDGVLTKPFEFAARDALSNGYSQEIYDSVLSTIAAVPSGKTLVGQINDHDSERLASVINGSFAVHKAAAAVLLTQPFPPNIYYGDEIGMRGSPGNFGSDANDIPDREPFKWNAVAGAPMSNYFVLNSGAYNARYEQNNDGRSVQEQQGVAGSLLETYKQLIGARAGSVALRRGTYTPVATTSPNVWAFVRQDPGQTVLVAINLPGGAASVTCNLSAFGVTSGAGTPVDLLGTTSPAALTSGNRYAYPVAIASSGFTLLQVGLTSPLTVAAAPATINGRLIPAEAGSSALVATQTAPTSAGDNVGELDQLFVRPGQDGLRIGITGNLPTDGSAVVVFVDTALGGASTLNTTPQGSTPAYIPGLNGTVFDSGFAPDTMIGINASGGTQYFVDQLFLSPQGAVKFYRGNGVPNSGASTLTGGSNITGLAVAVNNGNTAGVTATSAAGAATATSGIEMLVPYGDIGLPSAASARAGMLVKIGVALVASDGTFTNQTLPPIAGTAALGLAPNFNSIAGNQFAAVTLPHAGDFNGDGVVSVQDIFDFLSAWFAG